jgi:hypothetical protein
VSRIKRDGNALKTEDEKDTEGLFTVSKQAGSRNKHIRPVSASHMLNIG